MRQWIVGLSAVLASGAGVAGAGVAGDAAASLSDYRWDRRIVLVFTPSEDDRRADEQARTLQADQQGFADRDMMLVLVLPDGVAITSGAKGHALDAQQLRRDHWVEAQDFAVLLIGKDGGVKLRRDEPVAREELYALIDSMPMRRREMRETG